MPRPVEAGRLISQLHGSRERQDHQTEFGLDCVNSQVLAGAKKSLPKFVESVKDFGEDVAEDVGL
jgi:hypothetical protein